MDAPRLHHPEFTWSGTLFIIFGFGIFGLGQGLAVAGRRAGWRRPGLTVARVVGGLGMVPDRLVAVDARVLLAVACLPSAFVFGSGLAEDGWSIRLVVGSLLLLALYGVIIRATRPTMAPQLDGWHQPPLVRIGVAIVLVGFIGLQIVSILAS